MYKYLLKHFKTNFDKLSISKDFDHFIKKTLKIGALAGLTTRKLSPPSADDLSTLIKLDQEIIHSLSLSTQSPEQNLKLISPLDNHLLDGAHSHLPILQEIGNALSTVTWDSYAAINPYTCRSFGIKRNDLIKISSPQNPSSSIELAVYPMPGLSRDAVVIYQGGGINDKRNTIANNIGVNPLDLWPKLTDSITNTQLTSGLEITIIPTGKKYRLAAMQKHNDIANRSDVYKQVPLDYLQKAKYQRAKSGKAKNLDDVPDLYPSLDKPEIYMHKQQNTEKISRPKSSIDYRWGMSIDLDRCNGCGACMVACSLENNVPQVGKEQDYARS